MMLGLPSSTVSVENSERVTDSTIEDLYADGAYQSPDNREFAKNHNAMQLKMCIRDR